MLGCIVLNRVSLHCLVLQLPDRSDRPTMCDTALHVGWYCIESCVIALSGTAAAGWFESAYNVCEGMGRMVRQFNGRKEDTKMPFKYNAVHQQCGKYIVNLTPGNVYLHPNYRLDSLWMAIKEVSSHGNVWEGRTDNKKAIKVGDARTPF